MTTVSWLKQLFQPLAASALHASSSFHNNQTWQTFNELTSLKTCLVIIVSKLPKAPGVLANVLLVQNNV